MDKLHQLNEDRDQLMAKLAEVRDTAKANGGHDDETRSKWDNLTEQLDKVDSAIGQAKADAQRAAKEKAIFDQSRDPQEPTGRTGIDGDEVTVGDRAKALRGFLLGGRAAPEHRQAMAKLGIDQGVSELPLRYLSQDAPRNAEEVREFYRDAQKRAQAVGTDAAGGYLVNPELIQEYEQSLLYYCQLRQYATVIRTESGADLPVPTSNDTGNKGALLAENAQAAEQDVTLANINLQAFMFNSKMIRVSYQFLNDSFLNVDRWLGALLGERIGRIETQYFTTGTGSSQPQGLTAGAGDSSVTLASNTAVTYDELLDIFHAVDPAYRNMPSAAWCFHDDWLKYIRKVKDSQGNPIWEPGYGGFANASPPTIFGKPYVINNEMPTGASAKVIVFGDMSKLYLRDVNQDMRLVRLDERYADYGQVAFLMWARCDSRVIDAGTDPLVYATSAA